MNTNFLTHESNANGIDSHKPSIHSSGRAWHGPTPALARWGLLVVLLLFNLTAYAQTFSGHLTFSDLEGTNHVLQFENEEGGQDGLGTMDVYLPGYDWQGDGSNQGPQFHLSCSATLVGTMATVNRSTESNTPPSTFPPASWNNGQAVTIIDFEINRVSSPGGDCEADDYANLSIEKTVDGASSATVDAGGSFTYELVVTNTGTEDLTNVFVSDELDLLGGNLSVDSVNPGSPTCEVIGTTLECNFASLSTNDSETISLTLSSGGTTPEYCGGVENLANATGESSGEFDPVAMSNVVDVDIVNCETIEPGQIEIIKNTVGGNGSFDFTGDLGNFTITTSGGSGNDLSTDLSPGPYSISEVEPAGWDLTSITCESDSGSSTSTTGETASIDLGSGGDVTCTFTNTLLEPGIEITKSDGNQIVSQESSFAYSLDYTNTGELDLTDVVITETVPDDTTFDANGSSPGWSCADGAGPGTVCEFDIGSLATKASGSVNFGVTVDLLWEPDPETGQCDDQPSNPQVDNTASIVGDSDNGEASDEDSDFTPIQVSCEDLEAVLIVEKVVSEGDANESFQFTGSVSDDGFGSFNLSGGESRSFGLAVGTYSVSETVPEGWDLQSATCTGDNTVDNIELTEGESVTCTFTNRELDPGISIQKSDSVNSVGQGGNLVYTLKYSNNGEVDLTDVVITETIPDHTSFNSSGPGSAAWDCEGEVCTYTIGSLPAGDSGEVLFPLTVDMIWQPDPETGQCPPEPEIPEVNNIARITGISPDDGEVRDRDSENTPISAICQDSGGELEDPPIAVPVNHPLGIALLAMLMMILAGGSLRRGKMM